MKQIAIILIVLTLFIAGTVSGDDKSVGRFQLFQGTFVWSFFENGPDGKPRGNEAKLTGLFLLDTATGEVRQLLTGVDHKGHAFQDWKYVGGLPQKNFP
jgi:hypothetical protein